ncbi:MAG: protein kinase [Woeseiaceae bacterium]|nr:protein kinase [Woeseiaceae bacterium]
MSTRVLIIDGQPEFRELLMHHVSAHWPDAVINDYDPLVSGRLRHEFSGAGNDLILLGNRHGDIDGLDVLKQFARTPGFPPVIYFGSSDADGGAAAKRYGAAGFMVRESIQHSALTIMLGEALRTGQRQASTGSLFVGDMRTGIRPLIRGYRLVKRLSASGHSAVYLADKESSGTRMVLKVLQQPPEQSDGVGPFDRFLREYELIADIRHPNIVRIYDLGVSDDHAHIAMEYLSGGDLKNRLLNGIQVGQAVEYTRQVASALAAIHNVGILHRDLKPGNIMLRDDDTVALIDFGLAKHMRLQQEITDSGEIFGTPYYMSPEQGHANDVDQRSDIYSLGVIFYEMLTGEKPYRGSNAMSIIFKHSKAPIPLLPPRLGVYQALLNLLLAKKPEDRLSDAAEILEWLA